MRKQVYIVQNESKVFFVEKKGMKGVSERVKHSKCVATTAFSKLVPATLTHSLQRRQGTQLELSFSVPPVALRLARITIISNRDD